MEKWRPKIRNLEDHEMVNPKHHLSIMSLIHNRFLPNQVKQIKQNEAIKERSIGDNYYPHFTKSSTCLSTTCLTLH